MTIHKEGRTLLLWSFLVSVALVLGSYLIWPTVTVYVAGLCAVVFILFLQFFRSPIFSIPIDPNHILAPADGKVVVIEETFEKEYLKKQCIQISIFMSPFNVHVNRSPVSGMVSYFKYHPGKYLVAWHPKSSEENERTTVVVQQKDGVEVLFRQIAGAVARRIRWYVQEGDSLNQGDEFGFIKFGSRVDIFVPLDSSIEVVVGQKTLGGRTVIASHSKSN